MHYTQALLLLFLAYLLAFTSAGQNDIGEMFPPRDLLADIDAKDVLSLLPRAGIQVRCTMVNSYDETLAPPPDMIATLSVRITGLPDADDHVDKFRQALESICTADNLLVYNPRANLGRDEVVVNMKVRQRGPPYECYDAAIRQFTNLNDFLGCDNFGI